jgi:hypothetical protein
LFSSAGGCRQWLRRAICVRSRQGRRWWQDRRQSLRGVPPGEAAGPVSHLILTYGYLAVFGLTTAEDIGVPVPGEAALIVAAAYAGHTHRPAAPGEFQARGR